MEVDAPSSMWPIHDAGSPSRSASQPSVTCSSSVAAGDVRQSIAFWLSAAISSSARIPGSEAVMPKYAKKRGWFQCVMPGSRIESRSASTAENGSPTSGARAGSCARIAPGATRESTGSSRRSSR